MITRYGNTRFKRYLRATKMQPYREYRGWDWTELCEALNLPSYSNVPYDDDRFDLDHLWLKEYMIRVLSRGHWKSKRSMKRLATEIRSYCQVLSKEHKLYAPIWLGYSQVTDDYVLVQMFIPVIRYAWS